MDRAGGMLSQKGIHHASSFQISQWIAVSHLSVSEGWVEDEDEQCLRDKKLLSGSRIFPFTFPNLFDNSVFLRKGIRMFGLSGTSSIPLFLRLGNMRI